MTSQPPKLCRYGCGQMIIWDPSNRYFVNEGTNVRHDCPARQPKGRAEPPGQPAPQPKPSEPPLNDYNIGDVYLILEELTRHVARIADALERR